MRRDLIEFAANLASLAVVLGSLIKQRRLKRKPMSVKTVAVIVAMEAEAAPLIERLGLKKQEKSPFAGPLPAVVFSGAVGDATVHVCTNGPAQGFGVDSVGTVPAALTAYQACETLKPDLLVNAGTAGGFKAKGGAVGDVYLATAFKNHDRRIQIPGFDVYGVGAADAAACPNLRAHTGFKAGVVSTGNSLDCPDVDRDALAANDASVKEMEAAGHRARRHDVRHAVHRRQGHHGHRRRGQAHARRVPAEPRRRRQGAAGSRAQGARVRRREKNRRPVMIVVDDRDRPESRVVSIGAIVYLCW
jgi:5'-methylthioadenosine nucleosidase